MKTTKQPTTITTSKVEMKQSPYGNVETVTLTKVTETDIHNGDIEITIQTTKKSTIIGSQTITETTGKMTRKYTDTDCDYEGAEYECDGSDCDGCEYSKNYTGMTGSATVKEMIKVNDRPDGSMLKYETNNMWGWSWSTTKTDIGETGTVNGANRYWRPTIIELKSHDEIELFINKLFY